MSTKSEQFLAPHLRHASNTTRHAAVTRAVTHERAKTGSWAPAPMQAPAASKTPSRARGVATLPPQSRLDPATGQHEALSVGVSLSLSEAVALVSAALQMADHSLVSSARWETQGDEARAGRDYSRAVMYEAVAERIAKAARNSG